MPPQRLIDLDLDQFDFHKPLFNLEEIRRVNPQRHEMEQLTGILYVKRENHEIIGFKDITDHEFWIAGHMPGFPLMPGVILCESAAQLAGFYARKYKILGGGDYLGFGGMNTVRFRAPVYPDCRLILMARAGRIRPNKRAEFAFQGFVNDKMVFEGEMIGVPISRNQRSED